MCQLHSVSDITKFYNSVISKVPHITLGTFETTNDRHDYWTVYQQLLTDI